MDHVRSTLNPFARHVIVGVLALSVVVAAGVAVARYVRGVPQPQPAAVGQMLELYRLKLRRF